jgi:hypothetical protein
MESSLFSSRYSASYIGYSLLVEGFLSSDRIVIVRIASIDDDISLFEK